MLGFYKTCKLWSSKAAITVTFFAQCHQSWLRWQATDLETQKHTKRIKPTNHKSQTMTFRNSWSKLLFPKRSAKMIDGSKKCKRQLAFALQNLYVYEKHSNFSHFFQGVILLHSARNYCFEVLMLLYLQTILCTQGTICTCCDSVLSLVNSLFSLVSGYGMIMSLKESKIRFEPRIKLSHNMN